MRNLLFSEQIRIQEDWIRYFHELLPTDHPRVLNFNHRYPLRSARSNMRTLELGARLGEHLRFEDREAQEYHAIELRQSMAEAIYRDYPHLSTSIGVWEKRLPYPDNYFDRVIAIHLLEHLDNLPAALAEVQLVLRAGGVLAAVVPREGGFAYRLGRRLTTQRVFERRYGVPYDWHVRAEHPNWPGEVFEEIAKRFAIRDWTFFRVRVPIAHANLVVGITATLLPEGNHARVIGSSRS